MRLRLQESLDAEQWDSQSHPLFHSWNKNGHAYKLPEDAKALLDQWTSPVKQPGPAIHQPSPPVDKPLTEVTFSEFHSQILNNALDHQIVEKSMKKRWWTKTKRNKQKGSWRKKKTKIVFIITNVLIEIRKDIKPTKQNMMLFLEKNIPRTRKILGN